MPKSSRNSAPHLLRLHPLLVAMPLSPPDQHSPTSNSEAEPPEPPVLLEPDDDNERFHGKMTNKISDAPARSKCVLTLTPLLLPPAAERRPCPPLVDRDRVIPHSAHASVDFDFRRDPLAPPLLTSGSGDSSPAVRRRANKAPLCKQTSEASAPPTSPFAISRCSSAPLWCQRCHGCASHVRTALQGQNTSWERGGRPAQPLIRLTRGAVSVLYFLPSPSSAYRFYDSRV